MVKSHQKSKSYKLIHRVIYSEDKAVSTFWTFIMVGACLYAGFVISNYNQNLTCADINNRYNASTVMPLDHQNVSLFDAVDRYVNETRGFFKYNISNLYNYNLTFEQLKTEGGVCYQWAEYYKSLALADNFSASTVRFEISENEAHEVAIITNKEGYCVVDQTNYQCWGFPK